MARSVMGILFVAAIAVVGCGEAPEGSQRDERVAPPDPFVVTTKTGARLTGAAARIDIRRAGEAAAPEVEVTFSASGESQDTWTAQVAAPAEFLTTLTLDARVVDTPLGPGDASVQIGSPSGDARSASAGRLQLRVQGGRLTGEASGMGDDLAATFDGVVVATCAVPAAALNISAPSAGASGDHPTLVVDEKFESALCKPYATLVRP